MSVVICLPQLRTLIMTTAMTKPDPAQFNLQSFADLLSTRGAMIGEDPGAFDDFHDGVMQSLAPATPYECVIAENLISIEWDLLQHQRMRYACLQRITHNAISKAVLASLREAHETRSKKKWDEAAALAEGADLAERAISSDRKIQAKAYAEITSLGMDAVQLMSQTYRTSGFGVSHHESEIQQLERRRRDVKRDYDALQKVRPLTAPAVAAPVIEATPVTAKVNYV